MSYTNPQRPSGISTKLGFIHLARSQSDGSPNYPKFLVCSGPGFGAAPLRGHFQSVRGLVRASGDVDGRALRNLSITSGPLTFNIGLNELAGGMPDTLTLTQGATSSQLLNNWSSYVRGLQNGLQFTRNAKFCRPRTGGSRYSGKKGVHTQWDTGASWPVKPFGAGDTPMTTYSNVDKQGAALLHIETTASQIKVLTAPIELDPDGWGTNGTDHGVEEDVGTGETIPETLLPVLCHGILCETTWDALGDGVLRQTTKWLCGANRTPADVAVTGAWRIWAPRIHLRGAAGATGYFVNGADPLGDPLNAQILGGGTYEDVGDLYEMTALDTFRDGVSEGDTLFTDGTRGLLLKEIGGKVFGVGVSSKPTAVNAAGAVTALTTATTFSWGELSNLTGDEVTGDKHNFLGIAFDITAPTTIPAQVTSIAYIIGGDSAAEVADRFGAV